MTIEPGCFSQKVSDILGKRRQNQERLKQYASYLYQGFNELKGQCFSPGALEIKHKELIALAVAVATRCIPCIAHHTNNALRAGAIKQEVLEAASIGVEFGGAPSFVVVRDNLLDFLDEIEMGGPLRDQ